MRIILFIAFVGILAACSDDTEPEPVPPPADSPAPDIHGHRGAAGLRPESTLPSFEAALDSLATTLELDLHVTSDRELLIWHDSTVTGFHCGAGPRTPDALGEALAKEGAELAILEHSAAELASLECDRNPDAARYPDQVNEPGPLTGDFYGLITLEDLFAFVALYSQADSKSDEQRDNAALVRFNIETKGRRLLPDGELEALLDNEIEQAGLTPRVSVQSFEVESLAKIESGTELILLTTSGMPDFGPMIEADIGTWSPNHRDLTEPTITDAHSHGLRVVPWTVNDPARMQVLVAQGVDGIITDRPDLAVEVTVAQN